MKIRARIFSLVLVLCLLVTNCLSLCVFGGEWKIDSSSTGENTEGPSLDAGDVIGGTDENGQPSVDDEINGTEKPSVGTEGFLVTPDSENDTETVGNNDNNENQDPDSDIAGAEVGAGTDAADDADEVVLTYEDDSVLITVKGSAKILPEGSSLGVTELRPDSEANVSAYAGVMTALQKNLLKSGENCSDAFVYDISLLNADGVEFEPGEPVEVKIEYKNADAFAGVDKDSIRVAHILGSDIYATTEPGVTEDPADSALEQLADDPSANEEEIVVGASSDGLAIGDVTDRVDDETVAGASADGLAIDDVTDYVDDEIVVGASLDDNDENTDTIEIGIGGATDNADYEDMTAEIVNTEVGQTQTTDSVSVTFIADSFSYYVVFGGNGSTTEPQKTALSGKLGWIRFTTIGLQDTSPNQDLEDADSNVDISQRYQWGFYNPDGTNLPKLIVDGKENVNAYKRILKVRLWLPKSGGDETKYDEDNYEYSEDNEARYFWTWQNQIPVDEFEIPGYEVLHTRMHTAWCIENGEGEKEGNGLEGIYRVRGYRSSTLSNEPDAKNTDLNVLNVYLKPLPSVPANTDTTHYVIRYVHADGSVTDGNVKELWGSGENSKAYFNEETYRWADEEYAGLTIGAGHDAIRNYNGSAMNLQTLQNTGKGLIRYDESVDLAKVSIYYKKKPESSAHQDKGDYDKNEAGQYYTGEDGLYTDKSVETTDNPDGRHYLLNLESWYVGMSVNVGMVLDSSGSMAWTSGIPEPITLTQEQLNLYENYWNTKPLSQYTDADSNYIPLGLLNKILDTSKTDNSTMGYNGYHYYLLDDRNRVNEYVALGYAKGITEYNSGTDHYFAKLYSGSKTTGTPDGYAVTNRWKKDSITDNSANAGWYYVNSTGDTRVYNVHSGKSYDGRAYQSGSNWVDDGPLHFYVANGNELWVQYYDSDANALKYSRVYEKRYKMFTKNETLQDAVAQFGAIMLGSGSVGQLAMTRFNQDVKTNGGGLDTGAESSDSVRYYDSLTRLKLLNWTDSTINVIGALNHSPDSYGNTQRSDGTYEYGLTGQTTTYTGVKAFRDYYLQTIQNAEGKKYLIIFTDGKDQYRNSKESDAEKENGNPKYGLTGQLVDELKSKGVSIVTVLMKSQAFNNDPAGYAQTQKFLKYLASYGRDGDSNNTADSNLMYFEADSNNSYELVEHFREIAENLKSSLNGYTVVDYIDPRYDVTNDAGDILTVLDANGEFKYETNHAVDKTTGLRAFTTPDNKLAYLGYDSEKKMFFVKYVNQTIPATTKNATSVTPWKSQIRIQAKEDFLGGNYVLTNGNDETLNKVYYPDPKDENKYANNRSNLPASQYPAKVFPQTSANPAILDEDLEYTESTIFLGESINPVAKFKWLLETPGNDNLYIEYLKRYKAMANDPEVLADNDADAQDFKSLYNGLKDSITAFEAGSIQSLTVPYYYLEDTKPTTNQPGYIYHTLEKIGWVTYTWEAETGDPYTSWETQVGSNNPVKYRLTAKYTADPMDGRKALALAQANHNLDGVNPNVGAGYKEDFPLKGPISDDEPDASEHQTGTIIQRVKEGGSPVITKRIYLSELENRDADATDYNSSLVEKIQHYLEDAEGNVNGKKDYTFTVSDGTNDTVMTLRLRKPTEDEFASNADAAIAYEWLEGMGESLTVRKSGLITGTQIDDAASTGYIDLSYKVASLTAPNVNENTVDITEYTITDAEAGLAIIHTVSGRLDIQKQVDKKILLEEIKSKGGVVFEFEVKKTKTGSSTADPEYWKLELVIGEKPSSTDDGQGGSTGGSGSPITFDKTITKTVSKDDIEKLEADSNGYITVSPAWEGLDGLVIGTYSVRESNAGSFTCESISEIPSNSNKKAYVGTDTDNKSADVYIGQFKESVPATATYDSTRKRLNAQEAALLVTNNKEIRTKLILTKKDSVDLDQLLKGAKFELFKDAECTTLETDAEDAAGVRREVFITDEKGILTITNLKTGTTYYLHEKEAPSGHYLLKGVIPVVFDKYGELSIGTITDNELGSHVWLDTDTPDEKNDVIVTNSPYFDLPSAGGPGNYLFTIIGVAVCAAVVLMKFRDKISVA